MAGQVGARDRLVRADQIENDAPIDIARSLAGSNLKIGQIDSSHGGLYRLYYTNVPIVGDLIRGLFFFFVGAWFVISGQERDTADAFGLFPHVTRRRDASPANCRDASRAMAAIRVHWDQS